MRILRYMMIFGRHMMQTEYISADLMSDENIDRACDVIKKGGLVAFPTETVYGLGADAYNESAAKKIYEAKGRPSDNPLIVHISKTEDLYKVASKVPESALMLAKRFWPGPLTMVLQKASNVPYTTTGGLETVAVRLPNNEVARKLIAGSGTYIAAPSANTSGRPSPTKASHVYDDLAGKVDMILDGGNSLVGLESTIVDLTTDVPTILRPGYITREDIADVLGLCEIDAAIQDSSSTKAPKAPGMKYKHYAPKGELVLVTGEDTDVMSYIKLKCSEDTYVLCKSDHKCAYECYGDRVYDMGSDAVKASERLYDLLRKLDEAKAKYIYSETFDERDIGYALMNRMLKAAGHRVVEV